MHPSNRAKYIILSKNLHLFHLHKHSQYINLISAILYIQDINKVIMYSEKQILCVECKNVYNRSV